jgi:2-polyprenyl-3-methyl-5-hydroxy-6-metoxy-1,4-benzoquinol methylase
MMSSTKVVRDYFDREAKRFDAIYECGKPLVQRVIDRLFRGVVVRRHQLICNLSPCSQQWSVLDVGCGSGRYAIALARSGAARVVGVDISDSMLDLAKCEARRAGISHLCEFVASSFQDYQVMRRFDVVVAAGYFDYLKDPLPDLAKMLRSCSGKLFASFPKRWEIRMPVRRIRFALARGFVRFYSQAELLMLFSQAGHDLERLSVLDLGRDWIAVARVN